jgi:ketosteroid isomerase-like protein
MEPSIVVENLWACIQARYWAGVAELVAEDAVVEWPLTAERIVGRDNFVAVNREYPEGWSARVLRVVAEGDQVVSEVEVVHQEAGLFQAVSLWTVRDGRIVQGREYWTSPGSETRPQWREPYTEPMVPAE